MSQPNFPTLLYPNGGEIIIANEINIRWKSPSPFNADGRTVAYELYYTDQYDHLKEPDWKQIAVVSKSLSQYVWRFGNAIRSSRCRVAVRSRNGRGERSIFSLSANNFSIHRKKIDPPTVIAPISGERFDKTVSIVTNDVGIIGNHSERSFYQFYYSSASANVPLTLIAQNVAVGSGEVIWETISLPPAKDYIIQLFLADDDGNASESIFIRNIEIAHEGFFIVDTKAPEASIVINSKANSGSTQNATFTKNRDVSIQVVSFDESTAVHTMQFIDGDNSSTPEPSADVANFTLSSGDDIKRVELFLQDFGGNRNDQQTQRLFETFIELEGNAEVVDIAIDRTTSTAWVITSTPYNYLYKIKQFPSLITAFEDEPTAIAVFSSFVFVGVKTAENTGTIMRYDGFETTVIKTFLEADSIITSMTTHAKRLYIGFENGMVYSFDGLTFRQIPSISNPVNNLVSDGSSLYLTERNGTDVYVFNGTQFIFTGV